MASLPVECPDISQITEKPETQKLVELISQLALQSFPTLTQPYSTTNPVKHNIVHHIETMEPPTYAKVPERLKQAKAELECFMPQGILRPSSSNWSSALQILSKNNGDIRPCDDYCRFMDEVLRGLPFYFTYIDDVLFASPDEATHRDHLKYVFTRLQDYGIHISFDKSEFGFHRLPWTHRHTFRRHPSLPIAFFSKKLNNAEKKYNAFDKELLAIYEAVNRFRNTNFITHDDLSLHLDRNQQVRLTLDPHLHQVSSFERTFLSIYSRLEHVHIDIVGPLFTCAERFTHGPEAIPLAATNTDTVAKAFVTIWISRFGIPLSFTSDLGRQFESNLWNKIMSLQAATHNPTDSPNTSTDNSRLHS
ncbi:uncharacterized protein LOC143027901 [Oratosquilla oratoria]|uniref:uncharacterized protein LOC143027901 n=1 Tax=Oratosquilla oratoria TaxID=337810 RepID=UPI003F771DED